MSGIAGIIHFDGAPIEPGLIEKMTSAMAHRGPDGIHHWTRGSVALGHCMLQTTPESLEETQPLANEDESLVLVMDGRVDNWIELRRELLGRGAVLRTRADAELVLRAYEIWGDECLAHIDGDFSLVIWDARNRKAFCARDRMGNKPFYYHWDGKTLVFASEFHVMLPLPWVGEEPNEGMLAELLAWECYSRDETIWSGIKRLVAAHRMGVSDRGPRPEQYWEPDLWATLPYKNDEDYIEHYRELFFDSVRRMSRSNHPLACEVSGGLDSSAVFCVGEQLRREGRLLSPGIEGYTLAFEEGSDAYELDYARAVGSHLGKPLREIPPSFLPLSSYEERASTYREFPGFPNGAMSTELRRQASVHGSRVMFTGEWGDALLQGSRLYYAEALSNLRLGDLFSSFRSDTSVAGTMRASGWLVRYGVIPILPAALQERLRAGIRNARGMRAKESLFWLAAPMQAEIERRRKKYKASQPTRVRTHGQRALLEALYSAFASNVMDRLEHDTARAGVEVRHPFSDTRVVQHAVSTPERLRLQGNQAKYIHVKAMQGVMPSKVLARRDKADFSVVFRRLMDEMKETLTDALPNRRSRWVRQSGMKDVYQHYQDNPHAGWPAWVLWGVHGCDVASMSK